METVSLLGPPVSNIANRSAWKRTRVSTPKAGYFPRVEPIKFQKSENKAHLKVGGYPHQNSTLVCREDGVLKSQKVCLRRLWTTPKLLSSTVFLSERKS